MERSDFKSIHIDPSAVNEFNEVFGTFGYHPINSQKVYLQRDEDNRFIGETDMGHYYGKDEADEALLGLSLNKNKRDIDSYETVNYARQRDVEHYRDVVLAEKLYNRLTYDIYLLGINAKAAKRQAFFPLWGIALSIFLIAAGIAVSLYAHTLGGGFSDAPFATFEDTLYLGGIAGAFLSFSFFLTWGILRFVSKRAKAEHYLTSREIIKKMSASFRQSFRNSFKLPKVDMKTLAKIEKSDHLALGK